MEELQMHIFEVLRNRRDYFGIPNSEISRRTGIGKNTVAKIMNGYTNPSAVQVLALVFCLDMDPCDLYPESFKRLKRIQRANKAPACLPGCMPGSCVFAMGEEDGGRHD